MPRFEGLIASAAIFLFSFAFSRMERSYPLGAAGFVGFSSARG